MPQFESFDGVRLSFRDEGDGETIVLLHGLAADAEINFVRSGVVTLLIAEGYRVVALDARGHGRSEKPTSVEAYADDAVRRDVAALFDHLRIDGAVVVGYSMGADIALRFATHDRRVSELVLIGLGTADDDPVLRDERRDNFIAGLEADDPDDEARLLGEFRLIEGLNRATLLAQLKAEAPGFERRPATIDLPVLMIVGVDDTVAGDPGPLAVRYHARLVRPPGHHFNAHATPLAHESLLAFLRARI